jgi:murein DD-endopeptidase MepM/ murein hydrolase activator NlpD
VPPEVLVRVNHIRDVRDVPTGARLWIPRKPASRRSAVGRSSTPPRQTGRRATPAVARAGGLRFVWPVKGRLTSRYGRRNGRPHQGIDLAADKGTPIRASEAGKVIHAGRLGAYGKVVIVKHAGHYRTVYAHANRVYVRKGQLVERGQRVAEVGATGRASGPHLHFELRHGETPRDPMLYLRH